MAKKEEIIEVTNETEIEVTSVTVSNMIHAKYRKKECLAFFFCKNTKIV